MSTLPHEPDAMSLATAGDGIRPATRRGTRARGQSIVELAFALPVLLLILFGTVDLGRVFYQYIQMRNAAFEGARYGARSPSDTAGIITKVTQHGVPSGTSVSVVLTPNPCNTVGMSCTIKVTATRTFTPITTSFLQGYFGIGPWTLNASATARVMT